MKRHHIIFPATVLSGLMLGGCSGSLDKISVRAVQTPGLSEAGTADDPVAAGRRMLEDGHYGLAISRFRAALQADEGSAPAHNGLAVAYASLGRADLARRHFELAALNDPENAAYKRNLARLDEGQQRREEALAARTDAAFPRPADATDAAAERALRIVSVAPGSSLLVTQPRGRATMVLATQKQRPAAPAIRVISAGAGPVLERTSGRMVTLRTASAGMSPAGAARVLTVPIVRRAQPEGDCGRAAGSSGARVLQGAARIPKCSV